MNRLSGKVALITGGGTGIGRTTAFLYAREGAAVALMGRRKGPLEETAREIARHGCKALVLRGDVTDERSVRRAVAAAIEHFGHLDILINNAGVLHPLRPVHRVPIKMWDATLAVNLSGAFRMIRAVVPHMLRRRRGAIVNVSSVSGLLAVRNAAAYSVSKAGLVALTKCVAAEYGTRGIRCNCVCPGVTVTPKTRALLRDPQTRRDVEQSNWLERPAEAREIAEAILYLGSDESSFVTGAVLPVDGGCAS